MQRKFNLVFLILLVFLISTCWSADIPQKQGVYEYIVLSAQGELDALTDSLKYAAITKGWDVLAIHESGVPEGCTDRAKIVLLVDANYANQLMKINPVTAPFAVVDRVALFQDENGTHVAMVNPHSINRTIFMDDNQYADISEAHRLKLRNMITNAVPGTVSEKQYGQFRKKGYIGKTMGVMAGGDFDGKIKDKLTIQGSDLKTVSEKVKQGLLAKGKDMGLELVYQLDLPDHKTVVFGSSGYPMDAKSYQIVKAGSDKSRKDLNFPGLAYAGGYPLEVVVRETDEGIKVQVVTIMFRMKMYFEDAGKMAFMKNMGMPGVIEDEINNQINANF